MSRRLLPKRLEEDLKNAPKYKLPDRFHDDASRFLDESERNKFTVEKLMFDEIFAPTSARSHVSSEARHMTHGDKSRVENEVEDFTNETQDNGRMEIEFTTTLLSRLNVTEGDLKSCRNQLVEKIVHIDKLQNENDDLKMLLKASHQNNDVNTQLLALRRKNSDLSKQILEMKQFLADYGLVWVGFDQESVSGESLLTNPPDTESTKKLDHVVSFSAFQCKVNELNDLIKSEPMQIKTENGPIRRARLVHTEESVGNIKVTFYKNGIMVKRGPFRPCSSKSCNTFIRDIMDGFFPSELRKECPDGVIIDLRDRHDEDFVEGMEEEMSTHQLLSRLPRIVVRNGEVIQLRDDLAVKLSTGSDGETKSQAGKNTVYVQPLPSSSPASQGASLDHSLEDATGVTTTPSTDFATVQVRWVQGQILVVKVPIGGTIADIHTEVNRHVGASCPVFELRSAYPPRVLPQGMPLQEAGLIPNGTVHTRILS